MIPVDQRNTRRVREWGLGAQAPQRRPWHLPRLGAVVLPRKRGVLRGVEGSLQSIGDAAAVEIGQVVQNRVGCKRARGDALPIRLICERTAGLRIEPDVHARWALGSRGERADWPRGPLKLTIGQVVEGRGANRHGLRAAAGLREALKSFASEIVEMDNQVTG